MKKLLAIAIAATICNPSLQAEPKNSCEEVLEAYTTLLAHVIAPHGSEMLNDLDNTQASKYSTLKDFCNTTAAEKLTQKLQTIDIKPAQDALKKKITKIDEDFIQYKETYKKLPSLAKIDHNKKELLTSFLENPLLLKIEILLLTENEDADLVILLQNIALEKAAALQRSQYAQKIKDRREAYQRDPASIF